MIVLTVAGVYGQRRITPVGEPEIPRKATVTEAPVQTVMPHAHDSLGNVILIDTIAGTVDTIAVAKPQKKMIYPTIYNLAVGVDIWNPVMRIFGQQYGLASAWAELNMHNRYFPYFEFGLDNANDKPDNGNFTFKVKTAPFFKIGAGYNIFYNSNPDYQLKFGVRYGFTRFTYEVADVTVTDSYWGESAHFSMPQQSVTAGYIEIGVSVKVKIYRNFAMGWALKYHSVVHQSDVVGGDPMIIPGYGNRNGSFTGGFSLIYTLPLHRGTPSATEPSSES